MQVNTQATENRTYFIYRKKITLKYLDNINGHLEPLFTKINGMVL